MTDKENKPKIIFEPGCFDLFDGTQEELDALKAEIESVFANMTMEEIEESSRPLTEDMLEDLDFEEQEHLLNQLIKQPRNLQ